MAFVDRANVNGADNYAVAHAHGLKHAYFKATEGTGFVDSTAPNRITRARAAGIVVGLYHFGGHSDPVAEADFFLKHVGKPRRGDLLPALDLESAQSKAWAEEFVTHCHKVLGFWPALYGSTSFVAPLRASSAILRNCPWWRAEYGVNDGRLHPLVGGRQGAVLHQFTSVGTLTGIDGHTDLNHFCANPAGILVPPAHRSAKLPHRAWVWAQWRLGMGRFKGQRPGLPSIRPRVPKRIPRAWWRAVAWYKRHRQQP